MSDAPRIYAAIAAVQAAVAKEGISKDRKNEQQGYKFRGIDDIYNAVAPLLAANGLCIMPTYSNRTKEERTNQKGTVIFNVTVEGTFDFVSTEDGSRHTVKTFGEAMDSGDKATNKAMTAAFKYALRESFLISTGDDPDDTASEPTASSTRRAVAPALANGSGLAPSINPTYRETFHDEIFHELTRLELMNGNHPSPRAEEIGLLHGMPCWASKWGTANNATLIAFVDALKAMTE